MLFCPGCTAEHRGTGDAVLELNSVNRILPRHQRPLCGVAHGEHRAFIAPEMSSAQFGHTRTHASVKTTSASGGAVTPPLRCARREQSSRSRGILQQFTGFTSCSCRFIFHQQRRRKPAGKHVQVFSRAPNNQLIYTSAPQTTRFTVSCRLKVQSSPPVAQNGSGCKCAA